MTRRYSAFSIALSFVVLCSNCSNPADDLSAAIAGSSDRQISAPPKPDLSVEWVHVAASERDSLIPSPRAFCWAQGRLYVADGIRQRIEVFDAFGRHLLGYGGEGAGPGEFRRLNAIRCSPDGASVVANDAGLWRLSFFDSKGRLIDTRPAPGNPGGIPYPGEFVVSNSSNIYDSWLAASIGPYLEDAEWDGVGLVREWSPTGELLRQLGRPLVYHDPVLRRVFNRPFLQLDGDTLWVLLQGSATINSYSLQDGTLVNHIPLAVYHRGEDPYIERGSPEDGIVRRNRAIYQPNVGGFAVLTNGYFAVVRYRDWETVEVDHRAGEAYLDYWPSSFIEIVDRRGHVAESWSVPGKVLAVSSGPSATVAVLSEDLRTGVVSVLLSGEVQEAKD